MSLLRLGLAIVLVTSLLALSTAHAEESEDVLLDVPYRSQIDGTAWASSNCGPASIGMVLEAFDVAAPTRELRSRANQLLGISDPSTGTRIQDLARVVQEKGLVTFGPYAEGGRPQFRRWTLDDVRREIRNGYPVVPQVYYPLLPNHRKNPVITDHYVVIVGIQGEGFVFNDPADRHEPGYRRSMTSGELTQAWRASSLPYGAFSVRPGATHPSLLPGPTATPTPVPAAALYSPPDPPARGEPMPDDRTVQPAAVAGASAEPSDAEAAVASADAVVAVGEIETDQGAGGAEPGSVTAAGGDSSGLDGPSGWPLLAWLREALVSVVTTLRSI